MELADERRVMEELKQDAIRLTKRNDTILLIIARLEEVVQRNAWLEARVEQFTKALEFYANEKNYDDGRVVWDDPTWGSAIDIDEGETARKALSDLKKEEEGDAKE